MRIGLAAAAGFAAIAVPIWAPVASADVHDPAPFGIASDCAAPATPCSFSLETPDTTGVVTLTVNGSVIATGTPQQVNPAQPGGYPAWATFTANWTPPGAGAFSITATQGSRSYTLDMGICPTTILQQVLDPIFSSLSGTGSALKAPSFCDLVASNYNHEAGPTSGSSAAVLQLSLLFSPLS